MAAPHLDVILGFAYVKQVLGSSMGINVCVHCPCIEAVTQMHHTRHGTNNAWLQLALQAQQIAQQVVLLSTLASHLRSRSRCPCVCVYNRDRSTIGSAIRLIYRRCSQTSTDLHTDIQAYIRFQSWTLDVDNSTNSRYLATWWQLFC